MKPDRKDTGNATRPYQRATRKEASLFHSKREMGLGTLPSLVPKESATLTTRGCRIVLQPLHRASVDTLLVEWPGWD